MGKSENQNGGLLIPKTGAKPNEVCCLQCGAPLPEGKSYFCSDKCADAAAFERDQKKLGPLPAQAPVQPEPVQPPDEGPDMREVCSAMDAEDDSAIRREMLAEPVEEYVYQIPFKVKDRQSGQVRTQVVLGIGIVGVNAIAQGYGGLQRRIDWIRKVYENGRAKWECSATAVDVLTGSAVNERYRQPADTRGSNTGADQNDPRGDFSFVTCQRKALRNVTSQLIPQGLKAKIILSFKTKKRLSKGDLTELIDGMGGTERRKALIQMTQESGRPILMQGSSDPAPALPAGEQDGGVPTGTGVVK